jgi:hypothetical protein
LAAHDARRCNGGVEVTVFLGGLVALGCLTLGILEVLWPTRRRRVGPPPAARRAAVFRRSRAKTRQPAVSAQWLVALVDRARAETAPERRTAALRVAILTLERWRTIHGADEAVTQALERARSAQWAEHEEMALRRLNAAAARRERTLGVGKAAG